MTDRADDREQLEDDVLTAIMENTSAGYSHTPTTKGFIRAQLTRLRAAPADREPEAMTYATNWWLLLEDRDGLTVRAFDPDEKRQVAPVWIGTPPPVGGDMRREAERRVKPSNVTPPFRAEMKRSGYQRRTEPATKAKCEACDQPARYCGNTHPYAEPVTPEEPSEWVVLGERTDDPDGTRWVENGRLYEMMSDAYLAIPAKPWGAREYSVHPVGRTGGAT